MLQSGHFIWKLHPDIVRRQHYASARHIVEPANRICRLPDHPDGSGLQPNGMRQPLMPSLFPGRQKG
jgi:hypothetical protein